MNILYRGHTEALERAGLINRSYNDQTLQEMHEEIKNGQSNNPTDPTPETIAANAKSDRDKARKVCANLAMQDLYDGAN